MALIAGVAVVVAAWALAGATPIRRRRPRVPPSPAASAPPTLVGHLAPWWPSLLGPVQVGLPVAAVGAGVATGLLAGVVGAILGGLLGAAGPLAWGWWRREQRQVTIERQLPLALELVGRRLRAGSSLARALDDVGDDLGEALGDELTDLARRFRSGVPLDVALRRFAATNPGGSIPVAVGALRLVGGLGGAGPEVLGGVAAALRDQQQAGRSAEAAASQARLSALVVALLPPLFALVVVAVDARSLAVLVRWPLGIACLAGGLVLDVAGFWWMRRLAGNVT